MRFRLLYSGVLMGASRSDTRSLHKHEIRRVFSPQLRKLWDEQAVLREMAQGMGMPAGGSTTANPSEQQASEIALWHQSGIERMANKWPRKSSRYIPLVMKNVATRCRIDILFLRPGKKGCLIQGGDIDNRLKTIFDAFRVPSDEEVVDDGETWCVLLEDDSLISEVSIVTDTLLMLPNQVELRPNDAFLVVDVQIEAVNEPDYDWVWQPGRV